MVSSLPNCIRSGRRQFALSFYSLLNRSALEEKYSIIQKDIIDSSSVCLLDIEIEYGLENSLVYFEFYAGNKKEADEMNKIQLATTVMKGEEIIESKFQLSCTIDFCTEYYFNMSILTGELNWLFDSTMSPMELQEPLEKLLFNTNTDDDFDIDQPKSLKCYDDDEGEIVSDCDLDMCSGHANHLGMLSLNCGYLSSYFTALEVQFIFGIRISKHKIFFSEYLYNCEKNRCNSGKTFDSVTKLIDEHYNAYDFIKWPIFPSNETTTTLLTTTVTTTTTTKVTQIITNSTKTITTTTSYRISTSNMIDHTSINEGLCLRIYFASYSLSIYFLFWILD